MGENSSFIENCIKEAATFDSISASQNLSQCRATTSSYQHAKTSLNFYDPVAIFVTPAKQAPDSMVGNSKLVDRLWSTTTKVEMFCCIFEDTRGAMVEKNLAAKELSVLGLDTYYKQHYLGLPPAAETIKWIEPEKGLRLIITNHSLPVTYKGSIDHMILDSTRTRLLPANLLQPLKDIETINAPLKSCKFLALPPLQIAEGNVLHQIHDGGDNSDSDEVISFNGSEFSDVEDLVESDGDALTELDRANFEHRIRKIPIYLRKTNGELEQVSEFTIIQCRGYWTLALAIKEARPSNIVGEDTEVVHILWPWGTNFSIEYMMEDKVGELDPLVVEWSAFYVKLGSVVMMICTDGGKVTIEVNSSRQQQPSSTLIIEMPKRNLTSYATMHKILNVFAAGYAKNEPDDGMALDPWPMGMCDYSGYGVAPARKWLDEWLNDVIQLVNAEEDVDTGVEVVEDGAPAQVAEEDVDTGVEVVEDGAPAQVANDWSWLQFVEELAKIEVQL